jgi:hypothetical protein
MWNHYSLQFELIEPILGTLPKDRKVFENFIMDQAKTQMEKDKAAEDLERVPEETEARGWTGFYTDDQGRPLLMDYQFKGFLKNAGNVLKEAIGIKNLRSHINDTVFVNPRSIVLAETPDDVLERPLRALTAQGPRVSVARSDMILPGRTYELELQVLAEGKVTDKALREILAYGEQMGLLQWRNAGYGRFKVVYFEKE